MTLTEFLLARIAEDEAVARDAQADAMMGARWKHWPEDVYTEIQATVLGSTRRVLAECDAKRRIVEFHKAWPVLVETPPAFETIGGDFDINSVTFRASQQMAWFTQEEYRKRFGDEPPTAPMLATMAAVYADHPDYDEAWATVSDTSAVR